MSLPNGEDWLLRPVAKGMCGFERLKDGSVDLADIALMNEALDVIAENAAIQQQNPIC
ncbi:conserved phage-related hypothetical protein [Candidatus Glomeribacter gigasporarum BEG34]|uniref:Uncharacterized protein n=1 Tax=Candidatus Glomeribacter gigasporarum BEG34 TaxID=1070319 RepID=G2JC54_9BURK|nr:hypothetical protein [Candidatus Glomeribacter gigasporarum]CCD30362.1 conserved phage-related hypothetical protein [Candidatus Glomeribacter gigasporarum BEG34]